MLQIASIVQNKGYDIYFAWNSVDHLLALSKQLNIKLVKPKLHPEIVQLYFQNNPLKMYFTTRKYDLIFYLSDGSIPLLGGKNNIIHIQVPFHHVEGKSLKNQLKLKTINQIIVNSQFTKNVIDQEYGVDSLVVYPPVSPPLKKISPSQKQPLILSVGRFEPSLNIKRQDVLIKAFKQLSPQLPGWKLILAGSLGPKAESWVTQLRHQAANYPIEIQTNLDYQQLQRLYQQATIYWHAAGYQVDAQSHPELVEHFGITTVEAILNQCLPLVVPKGGQLEIVSQSQFHWHSIPELISKTLNLIQTKPKLPSVDQYSLAHFQDKIKLLI